MLLDKGLRLVVLIAWINSRGLAEELTLLKQRSHAERKLGFGQNQGIAWSSDSSLWGNQVLG